MKFASVNVAVLVFLPAAAACASDDDYREQRLALASQPGYVAAAYQSRQSALIRKAREAWSRGRIDSAVVPLTELLDFYPLSIMGHSAMGEVLAKRAEIGADPAQRARDAAGAKTHRETADRLVASITHGTRCASIADACKVINIPEEYEVVRALGGGRPKGQALLPNNGIPYDVVTIESHGDVKESSYYFDISAFFNGPHPAATQP